MSEIIEVDGLRVGANMVRGWLEDIERLEAELENCRRAMSQAQDKDRDTSMQVTRELSDWQKHVTKARQWIGCAQDEVGPDSKPPGNLTAWQFLNEALVELGLAEEARRN